MTKRPALDLGNLLAGAAAVPMPLDDEPGPLVGTKPSEPRPKAARPKLQAVPKVVDSAKPVQQTAEPVGELVNLSFKVPRSYRRRFKSLANEADISQHELLFQAVDAWIAVHTAKP